MVSGTLTTDNRAPHTFQRLASELGGDEEEGVSNHSAGALSAHRGRHGVGQNPGAIPAQSPPDPVGSLIRDIRVLAGTKEHDMCGIVGYVGPRPTRDVIIPGLERLEYRGYDSAGIARSIVMASPWSDAQGASPS